MSRRAKKATHGGRRAGSGGPVVWTHALKVWLLVTYYSHRASGKTDQEAWQFVAYRLGREAPGAKLTKVRFSEARRDVQVSDLPFAFDLDMVRSRPLTVELMRRMMADPSPFKTIAEWSRHMLKVGRANRPREQALRSRLRRRT